MNWNWLTVLGDSFSAGYGDDLPNGERRGWVSRFATAMDLPERLVCNLATYGSTTSRIVKYQLPRALCGKAPLVVIVAGANDLLRDYESFDAVRFRDNMHTILDGLAGVDTTVVTSTLPDIPRNLKVNDLVRQRLRDRFAQANETVEQFAIEYGTLCIDLHRPVVWQEDDMWGDELHPGPRGHQFFVDELVGAVTNMSHLSAA